MNSKLFLSLILAIGTLNLQAASENIATKKSASKPKPYKFNKKNSNKKSTSKKKVKPEIVTVEDSRYNREITADLKKPTVVLREQFDRSQTTGRPYQTTKKQEYLDNH